MHPSPLPLTCIGGRLCAAVLIVAGVLQDPVSLLAERGTLKHKKAAHALTQEQRAEHALNRLTFGPRPGDVERVRAIGVDKWIALQLSPERIDDSLFEARLQDYPAMRLLLPELIQDFPSGPLIRDAAEGKSPLPQDRVQHVIYQSAVAAYLERKQKQAEAAAQQPAASGSAARMPSQPTQQATPTIQQGNKTKQDPFAEPMAIEDASSPSIKVHEQKLFADLASTQIVNLPANRRWNRLLTMKPQEFRNFVKNLSDEERVQLTAGMTPQQKETVFALFGPNLLVTGELMQTRLLRDIYSQRQLQAVMEDFWLNHFNVYLRKGEFAPAYLADFERNAIEPYAMGKFEDLLVATAKSPAMLFYLDNHTSIGPDSIAAAHAQAHPANKNKDIGLNENYARELMELHTLGVDGGYTQKDVTEVAKVFTGWTIQDPRKGAGFVFNERRHEPGPKYVLGRTIPESGELEGLEVLHMLATRPATARHLSQQLAQRFVSDTPPPSLVNRMTKTYLKTDGDIRQVLRTMFNSPEFWSKNAYLAKVKTPEEFVISAVRATNGEVVRPAPLLRALNELGMPFYGCPTPNGYPWTASAWINTSDLLDRMNIALALSNHKLGTATDLDALMGTNGPAAEPVDAKEAKLEEAFLNARLAPQTRQAILQQADATTASGSAPVVPIPPTTKPGQGNGMVRRAAALQMIDLPTPIPGPTDKQAALVAGLLLGSPEFQKR